MKTPNSTMQAILDAHAAMGPLPIEHLTPELARQIPLADRAAMAYYGQHITKRALAPTPTPVGHVFHLQIPGPGGSLLARAYVPKGDAPKGGWPITVYFHGGGFVLATLDTYDASCRALCNASESLVISVHYRQAPEHRWPAAPQDALAAYRWIADNAQQFNGDAHRMAVAGESAGGNLAAVLCLQARDLGVPLPLHQLLIYPVTDVAHGIASRSSMEFAGEKPLNTPMLVWFYDHYAGPDADRTHRYMSPLHAELAGLPPATVILAEIDPLFSDGEAYAEKLARAGVAVDLKIYEGVTHEFFGMAGLLEEATDAVAFAGEQLKNAFRLHDASRLSQAPITMPPDIGLR